MFWTERENYRLRLVLSANTENAQGTAPVNAETQRPSRIFDGAWLGGYLDLVGYKGTEKESATNFGMVANFWN